MPGGAASDLHLDLHGGQVELVVEDGDVADVALEEAHRLADRLAAPVHEGGGLEEQDTLLADAPVLGPALERLFGRIEAMHLGDGVDRHAADIVPMPRILRARIAKETGRASCRERVCQYV